MNFKKAIKRLGLTIPYTDRELKQAYFKQALRYHPDKNKDDSATITFQEIGQAYDFLQKNGKSHIDYTKLSFREMIEKCLQFIQVDSNWETLFVQTTIHSILLDYKKISLKVFETMRKERAIEIYDFFMKYSDIFLFQRNGWLICEKLSRRRWKGIISLF